jgi:ferredoxin
MVNNREERRMRALRKIVEIDEEKCDGCGLCAPSCAEGAIQIVDGKAKLLAEHYCDGLGACLGECPVGALRIVEREADDFDEEAVEHHLKAKEPVEKTPLPTMTGCPSAQIRSFAAPQSNDKTGRAPAQEEVTSALTHWPVQIRLVPPTAPFLKDADLLVLADCTPVAYPNLHRDLLKGKTVMVGCPKFDDAEAYVQKFADIFKTANIKSVTVAVMEVPCCQALPMMVEKGMELAKTKVPLEKVVISTRGEMLDRPAF